MSTCKHCGNETDHLVRACPKCGCAFRNYDIESRLNDPRFTPLNIPVDIGDCLLCGVLFGVLMSIVFIFLFGGSIILNIILCMMGGLAFGAILALVMKKRESKAKTIKNEIARSETIIVEGWADNGSGWGLMITEGYMLITDKGIRYINLGTGKHEIKQSLSHENIQSITKSGKKLIVASDNKNYGFRVSSPDKWLAAINCR